MSAATPLNRDETEIAQFDALAAEWWNVNGPMAPLHAMNPVRLDYITQTLRAHFKDLKKLRVLDVGCGGGMVAEPLARLGANVTGIDGAAELIAVAKTHAAQQNLNITYQEALTSDVIAQKETFSAVLALEVIEHVPDPLQFVTDLAALTKPGGLIILSTLNRTASSWLTAIVGAEMVLRWLPRGTHHWSKFIKPSELVALAQQAGLQATDIMGLSYQLAQQRFALDAKKLDVNYLLCAVKS